ncbi:MAG: hypothetical protein KDK91_24780 [Gammaproteobacteria bacterium]|nr:hypothetical protein [Gammaproteobacteria bacterium]
MRLSYPRRALLGDLSQAGSGVLVCGLLLVLARPADWVQLLLLCLIVLFVVYMARVCRRHAGTFLLQDAGLCETRSGRVLRWDALDRFRLEYYSTRRDGRDGWFRLCLGTSDMHLDVDSRLRGFDLLLRRSAEAAIRNELDLDPTSAANLEQLLARSSSRAQYSNRQLG